MCNFSRKKGYSTWKVNGQRTYLIYPSLQGGRVRVRDVPQEKEALFRQYLAIQA